MISPLIQKAMLEEAAQEITRNSSSVRCETLLAGNGLIIFLVDAPHVEILLKVEERSR